MNSIKIELKVNFTTGHTVVSELYASDDMPDKDQTISMLKHYAERQYDYLMDKHNLILQAWKTMDIYFTYKGNTIKFEFDKKLAIMASLNGNSDPYSDPFVGARVAFDEEFDKVLDGLDKRKLCLLFAE